MSWQPKETSADYISSSSHIPAGSGMFSVRAWHATVGVTLIPAVACVDPNVQSLWMMDEGIQTDGAPCLIASWLDDQRPAMFQILGTLLPLTACSPAAFLNAFELVLESTTTAALRHS